MDLRLVRTIPVIVATLAFAMWSIAGSAHAAPPARIVGGEKVSAGDFESRYGSIVSVQVRIDARLVPRRTIGDGISHVCGGTLIAPRLVLTAAHCVAQGGVSFGAGGYEVLAGTPTLSRTRTTTGRVAVDEVFVHPSFRGSAGWGYGFGFGYGFSSTNQNSGFDVAVLRLERDITGVNPTPLVAASEEAAWGGGSGRLAGAIALGWGATIAPGYGRFSRYADRDVALRSVELPIRADRRCERSDGGLRLDAASFDATTMICAGVADGPAEGNVAKAACYGDSGGPLLAPATDGSLRVVGVASWTTTRRACASWSVFARVAALRDWIESVPAESGGPNGLTQARDVRARTTGINTVLVRWSPSASGTATRYHVYREIRLAQLSRVFGFGGVGTPFAPAGSTDTIDTSLEITGVAPRRPGTTATRLIRVDAQDADGNRVQGVDVAIDAPVDGRAPSRPGAPTFLAGRRFRGPSLGFQGSFDADCIARYVVEVRGSTGGWRTNSSQELLDCEAELIGLPPRDADDRTYRSQVQLRGLAAGTWRARVVAVDRAGNRAISRSIVFHLDERIQRSRFNRYCISFGPYGYCGQG